MRMQEFTFSHYVDIDGIETECTVKAKVYRERWLPTEITIAVFNGTVDITDDLEDTHDLQHRAERFFTHKSD